MRLILRKSDFTTDPNSIWDQFCLFVRWNICLIIGLHIFLITFAGTALAQVIFEGFMSGNVTLPCDMPRRVPGDKLEFIFWYKDDDVTPLYAVDNRGNSTDSHFRNSVVSRAFMTYNGSDNSSPTGIHLMKLTENDTGQYYCRIDLQWTSTKITNVMLRIVSPVEEVLIRDHLNNDVDELIGPYKEMENAVLVCEAHGGDPPPNVTWWRGERLYDDSFENTSGGGVINYVTFHNLNREDLDTPLRCEAQNTKIAEPVSKSVMVDLFLPPMTVEIVNNEVNFSAGHLTLFECETTGSRPAAQLSWTLNYTTNLLGATVEMTEDTSRSVLKFKPLAKHNRLPLICRAENKEMYPGRVLETKRYLNITFPPRVRLRVMKDYFERIPTEGDYFRLNCDVRANPDVYKIGWMVDGKIITEDHPRADVSVDNSIVMHKLSREDKGKYRCYALNSEGRGVSEEMYLNVTHRPVCKPGQKTTYKSELNNLVKVRCEVESYPDVIGFRWEFGRDGVFHSNFTQLSDDSVSFALISVQNETDYGTLYCSANNSVGDQVKPCLFFVISPSEAERLNYGKSESEGDGFDFTNPVFIGTTVTIVVCMAAIGLAVAGKYCYEKWRADGELKENERNGQRNSRQGARSRTSRGSRDDETASGSVEDSSGEGGFSSMEGFNGSMESCLDAASIYTSDENAVDVDLNPANGSAAAVPNNYRRTHAAHDNDYTGNAQSFGGRRYNVYKENVAYDRSAVENTYIIEGYTAYDTAIKRATAAPMRSFVYNVDNYNYADRFYNPYSNTQTYYGQPILQDAYYAPRSVLKNDYYEQKVLSVPRIIPSPDEPPATSQNTPGREEGAQNEPGANSAYF